MLSGILALAAFLFRALVPLLEPATWFVSGVAALWFLRLLTSRTYVRGFDLVNLAMLRGEPWPGKDLPFRDPDWGLFGSRVGDRLLLWVRAVLFLGALPAFLVQHWSDIPAGDLWFAATFLAIELSIIHAIFDALNREMN
jgi:hypothetical protein